MKKIIALLLALSCVLALVACSKTDEATTPTGNIEDTASTETKTQNEVLQFFADKYDMKFTLWGPEGQDLYAFYIYPNHAERECHILMRENTDDVVGMSSGPAAVGRQCQCAAGDGLAADHLGRT